MKNKRLKNIEDYYLLEQVGKELIIHLKGNFYLSNSQYYNSLKIEKYFSSNHSIILDFVDISKYDSFIVTYINYLRFLCKENKIEFSIRGMNQELESFYNYFTNLKSNYISELKSTKGHFYQFTEKLGNLISNMVYDGTDFLNFIGDVVKSFLKIFYIPRKIRWTDFPGHLLQIGVNAVPIALLIVFLIGLITGYQGALQLKLFGADIFIADLISISITRELAPLMVAIIVAGRSGSAFTAEIGTMKISEEIDALKMMGFNTFDFLVMPRLLAALVAVPVIVMIADVVGILGGLLAAISTLDITPVSYFNRMQEALFFRDILSGLIKAEIFAFFITIIGCFRGMQVKGGAESVGRYTTSSVVTSIFHIILIDAIFTLLFPIIGL